MRKAFARKKAMGDLSVTNNKRNNDNDRRVADEYNNNCKYNNYSGKLSAFKALSEIYNVQRSLERKNSFTSSKSTLVPLPKEVENNELVGHDDVVKTEYLASNARAKSDWFDYSEVDRWVQRNQELDKPETLSEINELFPDPAATKSLNELLSQVSEIDKIYADTQEKLVEESNGGDSFCTDNIAMELDLQDNLTCSSLQMAMKNPVWVRSVKRPIVQSMSDVTPPPPRPPPPGFCEGGPAPPLPPKRIRKTPSMPILSRASSIQILDQQQPPSKNLPTLPSAGTLTKQQSKPGLFSKLFSKKNKKESLSKESLQQPLANKLLHASVPVRAFASTAEFDGDGDITPPYGVELTEAENYALYTAMAPRATASEFDEMSFYYSPVENGKILIDESTHSTT